MKTPYARKQPKDGETILYCGHITNRSHFSWSPDVLRFVSPEGDTGTTRWMVECNECFLERGMSDRYQMRGHGTWNGDAPAVHVAPLTDPEMMPR